MLQSYSLHLNLRIGAWIVAIFDFLVGPIGFLVINRLSFNPHLYDKLNYTNIHPEPALNESVLKNNTIIMTALQGLVLNEWVASMIYYPPVLLTFIIGLELIITIHQQNVCIGKLVLLLNYILLIFLLILSIVLLANNVRIVAVTPFLLFSICQCFCLWIVFKFTMYELKHPSCYNHCNDNSSILPTRFRNEDEEEDLNL